MSSKSKRRVTVDTGNTVSEDSEKRKPSVFERLGPGAGQRKYSEYDSEREKKCRQFLLNGDCPYGATCKYKHVQLSRKSKTREEDLSPENLRLKLKGGQSERSSDKRRDSDTESHDTQSRATSRSRRDKESELGDRPDRSSSHSRRDKETKIKSQVVVKKSSGNQDSDDSGEDSDSNWFNSLDYKKELELEQKRQQLQRELSQLAEEEVETITIQKKVPPPHSASDSSPERGRASKPLTSPHDMRSTSPAGGRGKKEKKKHRTKSPPEMPVKERKAGSPAPEKPREHRKKHDAEEESHKKHKKKKEKKRSLSPPVEVKVKKKEKVTEEPDATVPRSHSERASASRHLSQSRSKRSRSSSSDSSASPLRSKDSKDKGKGKGKKRKSRGGKGEAGSGPDESPAKSKKCLSPLKKTLKLKKLKPSGSAADVRDDDERRKRRSVSPQVSRRGEGRDLLAEDPMPPSRAHDSKRDWDTSRSRAHSAEKRDKKHKGRRSESPVGRADREGSHKRGDGSRDVPHGRKSGRHSESPALQADRTGSIKRGDASRDASYDRKKWDQPPGDRDGRKGGADDRPKHSASQPRPSELYSPSQLDRESPIQEPSQDPLRGRQGSQRGDRGAQREDERRGQNREGRRGEKFDPRAPTPPKERSGQDRYSRRGDGDGPEPYGPDQGRFDSDRSRADFREGRGQESGGDREGRGRRADHFDRGLPPRDRSRSDGAGRDAAFDRPDSRASGGRDASRDVDGRERARDATRDRGDNRDARDREGRVSLSEGGKFGGNAFGPDGQRRSGQWEAGSRSGEWGADRPDASRDLGGGRLEERVRVPGAGGSIGSGSSGSRAFRDDGRDALRGVDRRGRDLPVDARQPVEAQRLDRGEGRLDRGEGRLDRGDGRLDRADGRNEGRLDRGDRGEGRLDRGVVDRSDGRLDRGDGRGDARVDRGDGRLERHHGDPAVVALDQRAFRQGHGGAAGPLDSRGGLRGVGNRSPVDSHGFDFDRRGARPGERDRDRDPTGLPIPPGRERFDPAVDFRRDDRYRDNLPEAAAVRDRRVDDRFIGPEPRDPHLRGGHRFDEVRDERLPGRGQLDDRQGRDRMLPRRGPYDFDLVPVTDVRAQDLPANQRRGPLLPTPAEELSRRGGRGDMYDRDLPRAGREGARDDRGRRDPRDPDFGPDLGRDERGRRDPLEASFGPLDLARGARDFPRDGARDPLWERDLNKDLAREVPGPGRRGRATPTEDIPLDPGGRDRGRLDPAKRERERSPRRDGDKLEGVGGAGEADLVKKREEGERADRVREGARDKLEASDARSTRSADDMRDSASQRLKKESGPASGRPSSLRGGRDRDSQSDGKRSPARSRGKDKSPLPSAGRRQPKKARSLSPRQRRLTPLSSAAAGGDGGRSPAKLRSPGRRGLDLAPSPLAKMDRRARSRTPVSTKRKLEEELRSPSSTRAKDDTRSLTLKRLREESRSPGRKSSRHPSPAGSHHSLGSHSGMEPRRRPGSAHRDVEARFFGQVRDRDSPARRDRDRERERDPAAKMEKPGDGGKGEGDKADISRKRGRSPPRMQGRGSDTADRGRKRWRGDGSWSDTEGGDVDKDIARQKPASIDPSRVGDGPGAAADTVRPDAAKASPAFPPAPGAPLTPDAGKMGRPGRVDGFGGRGNEDRMIQDGSNRGEDRSESRVGAEGGGEPRRDLAVDQDGADDSKDASLGNMLYEDDYEKISSDESDFEADEGDKQQQNIVSVLDIDWASLAKESSAKQSTGSLQKRFHPATVFSQIGISKALAGASLFDKVKALCEEGVKVTESPASGKGEGDKGNSGKMAQNAAKDANAIGTSASTDTSLLADVPVMHLASVRQRRERANLLRNVGPFRRALCARRDLEIRRQLCKVDKVYEQPAVFPVHVMDADLCKLSIQLFRQGQDFVDHKDSECDGKTELAV